ncbi:E3 Ubiquitin-Protein Ligase Marchf7 [Manis pentadactyla]|nr:E3 Ubiquitin-Protein Ligase Marchf7 [Manis pentadactyla]
MLDQGYGEAWVTSVFKVKCQILTKELGLALVALKLMATFRKDNFRIVGSSSDVKCQILTKELGLALVALKLMATFRVSVRSSHRVEGVIGDINGEGEISGPWIGSRFRERCLIRSTERIILGLIVGSSSDVKCQILTKELGLALVRH